MIEHHFQTLFQTYIIKYIPFEDITTKMNVSVALTGIIIYIWYLLYNKYSFILNKVNIFGYKNKLIISKGSIAYNSFSKYIEMKYIPYINISTLDKGDVNDINIIQSLNGTGVLINDINISVDEKDNIILKSNKNIKDIISFKEDVLKYIKENSINKIIIHSPVISKNDRGIVNGISRFSNIEKSIVKTLSNTFLSDEANEELLNDISLFIKDKYKYIRRGIAYKRGYILHGPPGTGKTSIIQAIASEYNCEIYNIDLSIIKTNELLIQTFNYLRSIIPTDSLHIILFEDLSECLDKTEINVNTFLNILDGVNDNDNRITFITCNDMYKIIKYSSAMIRPGRIDKTILIDYADSKQASKIISNYYFKELKIEYDNSYKITPADIIKLCQKLNEEDIIIFLNNLGNINDVDAWFKKYYKKIEDDKIKKEEEKIKEEIKEEIIEENKDDNIIYMSEKVKFYIFENIDILVEEFNFWDKLSFKYLDIHKKYQKEYPFTEDKSHLAVFYYNKYVFCEREKSNKICEIYSLVKFIIYMFDKRRNYDNKTDIIFFDNILYDNELFDSIIKTNIFNIDSLCMMSMKIRDMSDANRHELDMKSFQIKKIDNIPWKSFYNSINKFKKTIETIPSQNDNVEVNVKSDKLEIIPDKVLEVFK